MRGWTFIRSYLWDLSMSNGRHRPALTNVINESRNLRCSLRNFLGSSRVCRGGITSLFVQVCDGAVACSLKIHLFCCHDARCEGTLSSLEDDRIQFADSYMHSVINNDQ